MKLRMMEINLTLNEDKDPRIRTKLFAKPVVQKNVAIPMI